MFDNFSRLLLFAVFFVGAVFCVDRICEMKTLGEKNNRVKEVNKNIDQGIKTTNRILDIFVDEPNNK